MPITRRTWRFIVSTACIVPAIWLCGTLIYYSGPSKETPYPAEPLLQLKIRYGQGIDGLERLQTNAHDTNRTPRYMTLTKRHGRTGNQLFQYAMLLSTARRYGYIPVLPSDYPLRSYINMDVIWDLELENVKTFTEKGRGIYSADIEHLDTRYNWSFDGYFQSYKYHDDNLLQSEFKFKPEVMNSARDFMLKIKNNVETIVCVHVRRGDFTVPRPGFGHVTAPIEYLRNAMEYYRTKLNRTLKFVVVSNGMEWCKENIRDKDVVFSNFTSPGHDLALTSLCDHTIATCGTFSWWAGWLCGGHVVYYKQYPATGLPMSKTIEPADFYPRHWVGME